MRKNKFYPAKHLQSGQVALMVILLSVGILLVALTAGRIATEQTEISIEEQEEARIFNAAESGVEEALSLIRERERTGSTLPVGKQNLTSFTDSDVNYEITEQSRLETYISQGYSVEIPLTDGSGSISPVVIEWSRESCDDAAALLISVYSTDGSNTFAKHYAIDACTRTRFEDATGTGSNGYNFRYDLPVSSYDGSSGDLFARIKPIYNGTNIRVNNLPATAQYAVLSQAKNVQAGEETQAIIVETPIETAPSFMDYALVSGSTLIKN
ncbi:MAG: hypothetical protein PVJ09_05425 [Candidatus Woesebacteria bacterium]